MIIATSQLIDTYIRWLAFSDKAQSIKRQLWTILFVWSLASFFLYDFIFNSIGIGATTYKAIVMLGWLPYFLICMIYIPLGFAQHIFVLGMGTICSLVQHTISAIIILTNFSLASDEEIILYEITGYLFLFLIFFPLFGRYFVKLLPSQKFFDSRPQGIYMAIFPFVIVLGSLIRIADDVLIHSWIERLSRMYLPIVFFFLYRYILAATKNFYELERTEQNKHDLEEQVKELKEYNKQIIENQKKISVMRHDLRHNYNLIYAMLESGNVEKAREHISKQENILEGKA